MMGGFGGDAERSARWRVRGAVERGAEVRRRVFCEKVAKCLTVERGVGRWGRGESGESWAREEAHGRCGDGCFAENGGKFNG